MYNAVTRFQAQFRSFALLFFWCVCARYSILFIYFVSVSTLYNYAISRNKLQLRFDFFFFTWLSFFARYCFSFSTGINYPPNTWSISRSFIFVFRICACLFCVWWNSVHFQFVCQQKHFSLYEMSYLINCGAKENAGAKKSSLNCTMCSYVARIEFKRKRRRSFWGSFQSNQQSVW